LNDRGGIIDDLIVYRLGDIDFMLCVNAANIDIDWYHIKKLSQNTTNLEIENASSRYAQIAVQGKNAPRLLKRLTNGILPKRFRLANLELCHLKVLIARTGYTGEDGFEIFISNQDARKLWQLLLEQGQDLGIKPCGLSARDSLRLEAGMLLHGQDIDELTLPCEARLMFAVAMKKPSFIGKNAILEEMHKGIRKRLWGFRMLDRGIARHGYKILDFKHQEIGIVTSGGFPNEQPSAIGLCYIFDQKAKIDDEILIDIRNKLLRAKVVSPRFLEAV
jgi:aminomethyltransferase